VQDENDKTVANRNKLDDDEAIDFVESISEVRDIDSTKSI
jgi:hypothetical protein